MEYKKYNNIVACCSKYAYAIWSTKKLDYLSGHRHNYEGGYISDKPRIDHLRNKALKKMAMNKGIISECIIAVEQGAPNYCHFLMNTLPQVIKMWNTKATKNIAMSDKTDYAKDFFELLGIDANIIEIRNRSIYIENGYARYRYPNKDKTYIEHKELAGIRHIFNKYKVKQENMPEKIFIERRGSNNGSSRRKIEPIQETHQIVKEKGYEIIYLEDLDVRTKIKLFYNAKKIVTVHGAGLGNIIFCKDDCEVIEARNSLGMPKVFIELANELKMGNFYTIELDNFLTEKQSEELKRKECNSSANILPMRISKEFIDAL